MERHLGLDVHARSCTLAVVSESGKRLRDVVIETNGRALIEAIRLIPGRKHLCLEEGTQSAWLYEILEPHVVAGGGGCVRGARAEKRQGSTRTREPRSCGAAAEPAPIQGAELLRAVNRVDVRGRFAKRVEPR
jgi:hypothetical protein